MGINTSNMTEQTLIDLNFERTDVTAEESGYETDWYYYTLTLGNHLCLISNDNTEADKDEWYVEVFEDETIRFTNSKDIRVLIDLINRNTLK